MLDHSARDAQAKNEEEQNLRQAQPVLVRRNSARQYETLTEDFIKGRIRRSQHKCPTCWLVHEHCICAKLKPLKFLRNWRFIIYMSREDFMNGGDDAKLLLAAAPDRTHIFIHGKPGDDEAMAAMLEQTPRRLMLFPDDSAISTDEIEPLDPQEEVAIVLMDAFWGKARRMANHFTKNILPDVPHIKLSPTELSVYKRKQTQGDRICTIEAVALLLSTFGEDETACQALIGMVQINNDALKMAPQSLWADKGGHPAWYFGRQI